MKLLALVLSLYSVNALAYWKISFLEQTRTKSPLIINNFQSQGSKLLSGYRCSFTQIGNARESTLAVQCDRGDDFMKLHYQCNPKAQNTDFSFERKNASFNIDIKCFYL
jgi:hypothetical protein